MTAAFAASTFSASTPQSRGRTLNNWYVRLACITVLILLADWLFYGHQAGISLPLFILVLGACSAVLAARTEHLENTRKAVALLAVSLVPAIEAINPLTVTIAGSGLVSFVLLIRSKIPLGLDDFAASGLRLICAMPAKLPLDFIRFNRAFQPLKHLPIGRRTLFTWTIPVLFSAMFLSLFAFANPLIERWLDKIELPDFSNGVDLVRLLFWGMCAFACWPFLTPVIKRWSSRRKKLSNELSLPVRDLDMFGRGPVVRALLMFNGLFAVQTMTDFIYLWGHGALPEGVTFSQYAHNGTYALLAAALLSITFILVVTSDKRKHHEARGIRLLLLIWAAQNVILVVSTMKRMQMYIDAYALTYLRIAALLWMLLVLIGLILIGLRLLRERDNVWLIRMNLISLALVLYGTSLVNMPAFIANYNVANAKQNPAIQLDLHYLDKLGPQAVPAIDKAIAAGQTIRMARQRLASSARSTHDHWRAWSFRRQRLINYLNTNEL